jgi:tRNA threonylcarbamoyladenosine biosynthesis protein TsaE
MSSKSLDLPTPDATASLGRRLGGMLFPGAIVALIGDLGAGKTFLTRAIAEGLGADSRAVSSPTFVLIQEYAGRLPIYHFDAYRLQNAQEFFDLGAGEYLEGDGVCLIEWADRVEKFLPAHRLTIRLEVTSTTSRRVHIEAAGAEYQPILHSL